MQSQSYAPNRIFGNKNWKERAKYQLLKLKIKFFRLFYPCRISNFKTKSFFGYSILNTLEYSLKTILNGLITYL
jgi:hypothetical protein